MCERKYIGDLLADSDSDDDYQSRFSKTDMLDFLNREGIKGLLENRSVSAPASALNMFTNSFASPRSDSFQTDEDERPSIDSFASCSPALLEMRGTICKQALEQAGSRFLQHTLASGSESERSLIVEELMSDVFTVTTDIFGNYVVQVCLDHCSPLHCHSLINSLFGSVLDLSLHTYGCRVVQKALEKASPGQRLRLVSELKGQVSQVLADQNANHVVQKSIEVMEYKDIRFIIDDMRPRILQWATHCYGCRVLQRVIEHCPREALDDVFTTLLRFALDISQDAYGNYVVQHMFSHGSSEDRRSLFRTFVGQYRRLSKHKFSSNVVEKHLQVAGVEELAAIAAEMFTEEHLFEMMTDRYANFVVQKIIEASVGSARSLLISKVQVHSKALRGYPFGRHVLSAVNKLRKRAS